MTKKWNLIVDIDKCNGCYNCAIAAKDEYVGNSEAGYFASQPLHGHEWIGVQQKERGQYPAIDVAFVPVMCNHCDDAPCMRVAEDGAVRKRPDGIVIIDPEKAQGQKAIVDACPYGAVFWNEELQIPQHWPFDAHLLDRGWAAPRCVEVCATGALTCVKIDDDSMQQLVREHSLSVRQPSRQTKPRVYYKNLKRVETEFIAGTVTTVSEGKVECAEGAYVKLDCGPISLCTETDLFGDFRFDGLEKGSGPYQIAVIWNDMTAEACIEALESSRHVGALRVSR